MLDRPLIPISWGPGRRVQCEGTSACLKMVLSAPVTIKHLKVLLSTLIESLGWDFSDMSVSPCCWCGWGLLLNKLKGGRTPPSLSHPDLQSFFQCTPIVRWGRGFVGGLLATELYFGQSLAQCPSPPHLKQDESLCVAAAKAVTERRPDKRQSQYHGLLESICHKDHVLVTGMS